MTTPSIRVHDVAIVGFGPVLCSLTVLFLGPYRYPAVHGFDRAVQRPPDGT
jgi:hypothetical protein